jgi:hypothetical protein
MDKVQLTRTDLKAALEAEVNNVLEYVKSKSKTYGEALQLVDKLYEETGSDKLKVLIALEVKSILYDEMLATPIKEVIEISAEKRKWMKEVGIQEFKRPMKYHVYGWLLSEKYIQETPLEELKARFEMVISSFPKQIVD